MLVEGTKELNSCVFVFTFVEIMLFMPALWTCGQRSVCRKAWGSLGFREIWNSGKGDSCVPEGPSDNFLSSQIFLLQAQGSAFLPQSSQCLRTTSRCSELRLFRGLSHPVKLASSGSGCMSASLSHGLLQHPVSATPDTSKGRMCCVSTGGFMNMTLTA